MGGNGGFTPPGLFFRPIMACAASHSHWSTGELDWPVELQPCVRLLHPHFSRTSCISSPWIWLSLDKLPCAIPLYKTLVRPLSAARAQFCFVAPTSSISLRRCSFRFANLP